MLELILTKISKRSIVHILYMLTNEPYCKGLPIFLKELTKLLSLFIPMCIDARSSENVVFFCLTGGDFTTGQRDCYL